MYDTNHIKTIMRTRTVLHLYLRFKRLLWSLLDRLDHMLGPGPGDH